MKLSIVKEDNIIVIDGVPARVTNLDWLPEDVTSVFWDGSEGFTQLKGRPNEKITDIEPFIKAVSEHVLAKRQEEREIQLSRVAEEERNQAIVEAQVEEMKRLREYHDSQFDPWTKLRNARNMKLRHSDWTQLPDSGLSPEKAGYWRVYRQALRDLPQSVRDPMNPVWPLEPS